RPVRWDAARTMGPDASAQTRSGAVVPVRVVKPYRPRHARKSEPWATASSQTTPPIRRRFGQHFLSPAWAEKVVEAIAPAPGDVFLEIGPGRGAWSLPR